MKIHEGPDHGVATAVDARVAPRLNLPIKTALLFYSRVVRGGGWG